MHEVGDTRASQTDPISLTAQRLGQLLLAWGPLVLVCAGIYWFSSKPSLGEPNALLTALEAWFGDTLWYARYTDVLEALDSASSWIAHFGEYALVALTALWAFHRQWPGLARPYVLAISVAFLYALSDEMHQYYVPGRHADWRDVMMDWLGASVALLLARTWQRHRMATADLRVQGIPEQSGR